jgi:two-component sensor histidine kinase
MIVGSSSLFRLGAVAHSALYRTDFTNSSSTKPATGYNGETGFSSGSMTCPGPPSRSGRVERFMGTFFVRRDGTRPTQIIAPPRVAHFYVNLVEQKLYCLNETARDCIRQGVPVSAADLERQPLKTLDGEPVAAADLPLARCRREGTPQEVAFLLEKKGSLPQTLTWSAVPMKGADGRLTGVSAALVVTSPEPDWEELAGLAHDLRTPLQTVRWLVPVLETMPALSSAAVVLERLRNAADRAMAISHDLLEWCKAPLVGCPRAQRNWVPLAALLESLAGEQMIAAQRKGITLQVDIQAAHGIDVHTDSARLCRLIGNLLANSIRYTNTGKVRLGADWISAGGQQTMMLIVEDTGAGLATEDSESIFQPFQRGRAAKSDSDSGGSGLGLAVVDRLIHELGLTLEVFSEQGLGSRFAVLLPAACLRGSTAGV